MFKIAGWYNSSYILCLVVVLFSGVQGVLLWTLCLNKNCLTETDVIKASISQYNHNYNM